MTPTSQIYRDGFNAAMEGQSVETNPHSYGPLMVEWNDGWFAAWEIVRHYPHNAKKS